MVDYLARLIDPVIEQLLAELPALSIVGPRASGKTTTAARHAHDIVRLDRDDEAAAFRADPDAAIATLREPILFDEWQEVPGVLGAVKRAIDADPRPGRFILTGSVRAELDVATWPGTGRVVPLTMFPMTVGERLGSMQTPLIERVVRGDHINTPLSTPNIVEYLELALSGGFPEPATRLTGASRQRWIEGYVSQSVARDAPGIGRRDVVNLRRYLEACALHTGGIVDQISIARDAGVDRKTGADYDDLLQRLMLIDSTPAWTTNRLKRLIRTPKRFLVDASLLNGLFGLTPEAVLRDGKMLGRVIETFVMSQLRAEQVASPSRPRLYHFRQHDGRREIDVIAEVGAHAIVAIEVKAGAAPTASDARHLTWLRDELGDRFLAGVLLHTGQSTFELGDRLLATPISSLWA